MRRYLRQFVIVAVLYLGGSMAFNVGVDPYQVFGLIESPSLDPYKAHALDAAAKAEIARRGEADVILLGDSRVMIGLDPGHPALVSCGRVENLAFAGGSISEAARMLELALAAKPPKLIIWGIDAESLPALQQPRLESKTLDTQLNPELDRWGYYRRHLIGLGTTFASYDVVRRSLFRTKLPWNNHGQKVDWEHRAPQAYLGNEGTLRPRLDIRRSQAPPDAAGVHACASLLSRAQQSGARVLLFLPPCHALFQESNYRRSDYRRHAEECLTGLLAVVDRLNAASPHRPAIEVWDFTGFTNWHTEEFPDPANPRPLQWHWDAIHFQASLGDLVLGRMLDDAAPASFGVQLTSEKLPAHFARWRNAREAYHRTHSGQVEMMATLDAPVVR